MHCVLDAQVQAPYRKKCLNFVPSDRLDFQFSLDFAVSESRRLMCKIGSENAIRN